jgi:hypothetical protein
VALDDRRLVVGFATPHLGLPAVFTDLALGVAAADSGALVVPAPAVADLRDAVDGEPDMISARDPDLLDYARRRPGLSIRPLPWSRSYLLVVPRGASPDMDISPDTAAFQAALARDAVRAEARAPEMPGWWSAPASCPPGPAGVPRRPDNAIAYPSADSVARGLAERLVALSHGTGVIVRGLPAESLAIALRAGSARGFVVAVDTREPVPCRQTSGWPDSAAVIPLVETRAQAIVRRGAPPLVSDWDGTVRVEAR